MGEVEIECDASSFFLSVCVCIFVCTHSSGCYRIMLSVVTGESPLTYVYTVTDPVCVLNADSVLVRQQPAVETSAGAHLCNNRINIWLNPRLLFVSRDMMGCVRHYVLQFFCQQCVPSRLEMNPLVDLSVHSCFPVSVSMSAVCLPFCCCLSVILFVCQSVRLSACVSVCHSVLSVTLFCLSVMCLQVLLLHPSSLPPYRALIRVTSWT
jgi:hypothetical protein